MSDLPELPDSSDFTLERTDPADLEGTLLQDVLEEATDADERVECYYITWHARDAGSALLAWLPVRGELHLLYFDVHFRVSGATSLDEALEKWQQDEVEIVPMEVPSRDRIAPSLYMEDQLRRAWWDAVSSELLGTEEPPEQA